MNKKAQSETAKLIIFGVGFLMLLAVAIAIIIRLLR